MKFKCQVLDGSAMNRTLTRIAHEIIEKNENCDNLAFIGIKTRGIPMAQRLSAKVCTITNKTIETGVLDILPFRDDINSNDMDELKNASKIDFDVTGKNIVLTDDVIHTGRTIRAALDAVMSLGRPSTIQLAVMVDRGHRELPIRADYVGKNIPASKNEIISVNFIEVDGKDNIEIYGIDTNA